MGYNQHKESIENKDPIQQALCNRVRELRKKSHKTLEQLSGDSGVSRSMLSQIERGKANPTLVVAFRIAKAFNISLGELVEDPGISSAIEIIRGKDPAYLYRSDDNCHIRTLSPLQMEKDIEVYELRLASGSELDSSAHYQGTREFITIQKGTAQVRSENNVCTLKKNDSAHYQADVKHAIRNIGHGELVAFLVVTYM